MNTTYFLNYAATKCFKDAPIYAGLSTTAPNIDGTGATEPVVEGNGYGRILVSDLSNPTNGEVSNTKDLRFPRILKESGVATHYVLYDAEAVGAGHLLGYGVLDTTRALEKNSAIIIEAGELKLKAMNPVESSNT